MWPLRLDMSRDECRKCLRCLELDAYGNMVSVLRAQGSFTDEKQKLLQELAKVLHISNERHRAEIRRAINDEKLSTIAEQLNGPNAGTDWAIEGRRTIPLLPRLKAHTVFTGLANSLSLVTAAANVKEPSITREKAENIKVETESHVEMELEEKSSTNKTLYPESCANNRKRRRSLLELSDIDQNTFQLSNSEKNNDNETIVISTSGVESKSSPMPTPSPNKQVLVVSSPLEVPRRNIQDKSSRGNLTNLSRCVTSTYHQNHTVTPFSISCMVSNSAESCKSIISQPATYSHSPVQTNRHTNAIVPTYITATAKAKPKVTTVESKINPRVTSIAISSNVTQCSTGKNIQSGIQGVQANGDKSVKVVPLTSSMLKTSRSDNTNYNSPCMRRVTSIAHSSTKPSMVAKSVSSSSGPRVMAINSSSTTSSGPGPPHIKPTTAILTYKKVPSAKLSHQSTAKMGITLNSNKTLNITTNPNARLATKANVIVVQKGPARGVTLSHAGKEVLGKVIMGGKNVCLSNQHSASSIALLPHRVTANGDQTVAMISALNSSQPEPTKSSTKSGNMIVFDLRQDDLEKNKALSQFLEASGVFNLEPKTAVLNLNSHLLTKEQNKDSSHSVSKGSHLKGNAAISFVTEQEYRKSKEVSVNLSSEQMDSSITAKSAENNEVLISSEQDNETQGTLDPQTGIYNFHSSDDAISNIQIEEPISNAGLDIFSTTLTSTDINLESFQYMEDEESSNVLEEERSPILTIDQLNELYD